jgi:FkbM family methyltransferase
VNLKDRLRLLHRAWRYALRAERHEIALVRRLVRPGECVVDIGAHKAAFTYWMARRVGKEGLVLAFEPIPELAEYLRHFAGRFPEGRVKVFERGLSDQEGTATLHFAGDHLGGTSLEIAQDVMRPPIEVSITTLDRCLSDLGLDRPVSFIKCDVEHHELAVFRGARDTLARDKPILLFESDNLVSGQDVCKPVFEFLECEGFVGYFFHNSALCPIDQFDRQKHRVRDDANQNFVFVHPERVKRDPVCANLFPLAES